MPQNLMQSMQVLSKLNIQKRELADGWHSYDCLFGPLAINVLEIPAATMRELEWERICLARKSYDAMWSSSPDDKLFASDPFDGFDQNLPYRVQHYIATVTDLNNLAHKVLTMRKVGLAANFDTTSFPLPDDFALWKVANARTAQELPLWEVVKEWLVKHKLPLNVATLARVGTYSKNSLADDSVLPFANFNKAKSENKIFPDQQLKQAMSALALAMIQVAATADLTVHSLLFCQICTEFQEKAFALQTATGKFVLDFTKTARTLDLPLDWKVQLNNQSPEVRLLKTHYPGYWLDNKKAAQVLMDFVNSPEQRLSREVFESYFQQMLTSGVKLSGQLDFEELLHALTSPRNFKYLVPLLTTQGLVSQNLSGDEFRDILIEAGGDGPFSAAMTPKSWHNSALRLLEAAALEFDASQPRVLIPN